MRTEKQLEASRLNGTKSRGPVTPEGKRRSSENAYRHGLFARSLALQLEDKSHLREILAELTADHQPANLTERGLVETMAISRWKQLRFLCSEKIAIDLQAQIESQNPPDYDEFPGAARIATAITHMTEECRSLREINLHSARVNREHDRALLMLLKLQDRRGFKPRPPSVPEPVASESSPPHIDTIQSSAPESPLGVPAPESPLGVPAPEEAVRSSSQHPPEDSGLEESGPEDSGEAEPSGHLISSPLDKKITEQTHDSLKTNELPQVRSRQPGPDSSRSFEHLDHLPPSEQAPRREQPQSAPPHPLILCANHANIAHSAPSWESFP